MSKDWDKKEKEKDDFQKLAGEFMKLLSSETQREAKVKVELFCNAKQLNQLSALISSWGMKCP